MPILPHPPKTLEQLFEEQNALLRDQNAILRRQVEQKTKKPWVCGSWPNCYHGMIVGGIIGCAGMR
jgi:hypothetical protein